MAAGENSTLQSDNFYTGLTMRGLIFAAQKRYSSKEYNYLLTKLQQKCITSNKVTCKYGTNNESVRNESFAALYDEPSAYPCRA
jgi:hypothetical protein